MTDTPTRSRARSAAASSASSPSDTSSLRRVGEALLLAQNRARVSTERANRSERILRTVLSQINLQSGLLLHELEVSPRSLSFDALSDWDLVQTLLDNVDAVSPTRRYPFPAVESAERHSFALSMADARGAPHTLASVPRENATEDLYAVARDVVMNLHVAARNAERRIQKQHTQFATAAAEESRRGWLLYRVLRMEVYYYFRPWQVMAGLVLGFALGVVTAKRLRLGQAAVQQPTTTVATRAALLALPPPCDVATSTCRSDAMVTKRQINKFHLAASRLPVTFAMEDMSHLLHPPAEVS